MKRKIAIETITLDLGLFGEQDVDIHYTYTKGRPGCQYLPNGDPGHPDEPDEVEIRAVTLEDGTQLPQGWWDNPVCKDTILDILSSLQED